MHYTRLAVQKAYQMFKTTGDVSSMFPSPRCAMPCLFVAHLFMISSVSMKFRSPTAFTASDYRSVLQTMLLNAVLHSIDRRMVVVRVTAT